MSKCMSCGGFVTDNYARVFGDNDDNVFDCRNCRTDRRLSTDEDDEGDGEKVLLRTVRGEDEPYTRTRGGTSGDEEPTETTETTETTGTATTAEPTSTAADGGVTTAAAEASTDGSAAADPADEPAEESTTTPEPDEPSDDGDGRGRFGVRRFLSSFRS
jgi:hypothetical protein